jgi:nitrous oxide reductase accessory protein NosL
MFYRNSDYPKDFSMNRIWLLIPILALCLFLPISASQASSPTIPLPAAKDKCPVCGMLVAKYPDWFTSVTFRDLTSIYFDGTKDFFTFYHNIKKYTPSRDNTSILMITVRDYYHLNQIDARKAYYVMGSDVYSPMGKDFIPFEKYDDAKSFLRDHMGKSILLFHQITPALLKLVE